uniref:Uncharacterized protein n=1 Tax=Romanomermis culicivorax TaxID=13658 RepID=A0A915I3T7_ROMCU
MLLNHEIRNIATIRAGFETPCLDENEDECDCLQQNGRDHECPMKLIIPKKFEQKERKQKRSAEMTTIIIGFLRLIRAWCIHAHMSACTHKVVKSYMRCICHLTTLARNGYGRTEQVVFDYVVT